jgi:hypothetical protein
MKHIVGGEQSDDFLYFSTAPELPRTRVRQGERTDLPNLLSSENHHQQSASQERTRNTCETDSGSVSEHDPRNVTILVTTIDALCLLNTR